MHRNWLHIVLKIKEENYALFSNRDHYKNLNNSKCELTLCIQSLFGKKCIR